jgi:hypothetical protein
MTVDSNSATSGQEPTARLRTTSAQGASYRSQADDAGADERSGTDGGRGSPSPTTTDDNSHEDALTDPAALRAALEAARKEAAQNRKAAKEYADFKLQLETDKLSETEKLQRERDDYRTRVEALESEKQAILVRAEARSVARDLGLNPDKAWKLVDSAAVSFNDEGDPTNIRELMTQALQDLGLTLPASSPAPAQPPLGQPGVVARVAPPVPATGATNPPRGATPASQGLVRSVHDIQWRRG